MHAVCAAIRNPERNIRAIYAVDPDDSDLINALNDALNEGLERPRVTRVEKETLHKSVPREAVHQGVGCDTSPLPDVMLHEVVANINEKGRGVIVMLDQVTDPHNIGAIVRSAACFGADAIIVQSRNAPELNALIAKTACGGAEIVPIVTETNLARAIETLQKEGFFALALDERGRMNLTEAPDYEKTLIVFGAEGAGLRPLIRDKCDLLIRLPTTSHFSSLNVSNAAAITLYGVAVKAKG
jgi:23S rRNA (guanosine2251-2'-O)-methyltransferase